MTQSSNCLTKSRPKSQPRKGRRTTESPPRSAYGRPDPEQGEELVLLTDEEYLRVSDDLAARYVGLRNAYRRGMVTAENPAQEWQLAALREVVE
jgi:hypothetical protein